MSTHVAARTGLVAVTMVLSLLSARQPTSARAESVSGQGADALAAPADAGPSTQTTPPEYVFTDLGLPADSVAYGNYGFGADINNHGVVVGSWAWPGASGAPGTWPDRRIHAFKWDRGVLTEVTIPLAILTQEPFLTGCRPADPATQTASCSITRVTPNAIDDVGRIAGTFEVRKTQCQGATCGEVAGWSRGFVMPDGGAATMVSCPPGSGCNHGFAEVWGINNVGVVTGNYRTGDGININHRTHGFRGGTILDYPAATVTWARGINGRFDMDVVGYYQGSEPSSFARGFLFTLGEWVPIDVPGSFYTVPSAINDARDIVGSYNDGGFIWPNAPMGTPSGITDGTRQMSQALGNNDRGQIVGILPPFPPGYQRFVLAQLSVGPTITATTDNQSVTAGANATFTVTASGTPAPTYRWQVSLNGGTSFGDLSDAPPYSGVTSSTLTVTAAPVTLNGARYRAVATNSAGSATTSSAVLAVRGAASAAPSSLRFAAVKAGSEGAMTSVTGAQSVTLTFAGAPSGWTATSNETWLTVTGGSGSAAGRLTVAVGNPSNVIGGHSSLSATITITVPNAPNSPVTIPVTLVIDQTGRATMAAFGQVDTPVQNATGIVGAIGVTGWVVDDVGLSSVKIYRTCLSFDTQANCQLINGTSVVFIGDAVFVAGARPDVETAFPNYPASNVAGWGFLLLTNMLPHMTTQLGFGGHGSLHLYVFAADLDGHVTLLGRSQTDHSPTSIMIVNDTIAKPFGAIDTPGQGQTVSGILNNFGWALTPDSNATGGEAADIVIPTNGSTMTVFIDSIPVALVAYNQCRGNVGNPVPTTLLCNDDVSNIFGNPTPQAVLTPRTTNPTLFRNLDAGRAPIGVYSFNTTSLANGLHTIAWSVSDSAGRTEGIGSRVFNVLNSGADQAMRPAQVRGHANTLDGYARVTDGVWGRTGYDLTASWKAMRVDAGNRYRVRLPDQGRLEVWLSKAVDAGYLVAPDGTLRDLPAGSSLVGSHFGWMPPVGYVGPYHLTFLRGAERVDLDVTVWPVTLAREGESEIRMHLEGVQQVQRCRRSEVQQVRTSEHGCVHVEGWAFDPQAAIGSGIGAVHVWAQPSDVPHQAPVFVGAASLDVERPGGARAFPLAPGNGYFALTASLAPGTYEVTAYVWSARTARWEDARRMPVIVR